MHESTTKHVPRYSAYFLLERYSVVYCLTRASAVPGHAENHSNSRNSRANSGEADAESGVHTRIHGSSA